MTPVLATFLAVAAASDVALHRIPNALVVGVAGTGLVALIVGGADLAGIAGGVLAALVVGAAAWPAWVNRWMGGGDLKLAAAAAVWIGLRNVPLYLVASAIAVGGVSLVCYAASARDARRAVRRNLASASRGSFEAVSLGSEGGRVQVPAGVGFAIGALVTLTMRGGL